MVVATSEWRWSRTIFLLCLVLFFALEPGTLRAESGPEAHKQLTLGDRAAAARPLLIQAETSSDKHDPASGSLVLYRAAGAWLPLDRARSVRLYRDAFAMAQHSEPPLRGTLEDFILKDLLLFAPSDVLDLLPGADPAIQSRSYTAVIKYYLFKGNYSSAVRAFESAVDNDVLPQPGTVDLLASLPDYASPERARIFTATIDYYQVHPATEKFKRGLGELVAHNYKQLPRSAVLRAVDVVLTQAVQLDRRFRGSAAGIGGVSFHSEYDFQLFALAPALQELDPARADSLLEQHAEVADNLKRHAQGAPSGLPGAERIRPNPLVFRLNLYSTAEEGQSLSPLDMGLEFTIPRDLGIMGVTGLGFMSFYVDAGSPEGAVLDKENRCPGDLKKRLELARKLPTIRKMASTCRGPNGDWCSYTDTFPRASVIQDFAVNCTERGNSGAARAALEAQMEVLSEVPERHRIDYLATVADSYLRLGDREAAVAVVESGFKAARIVYDGEAASAKLRTVPKGMWASAEAYRRMVSLGVNASLELTRKSIAEIPDVQLRELEEVMIARALLGVPVRRYIAVNSDGSSSSVESEPSFDQFAH